MIGAKVRKCPAVLGTDSLQMQWRIQNILGNGTNDCQELFGGHENISASTRTYKLLIFVDGGNLHSKVFWGIMRNLLLDL